LVVLFIFIASWPLLKFETMRITEHISGRAGLYYALSATATVVLVVVLVIHVRYVFHDPETDQDLNDLAHSIDQHIGEELKRALNVMGQAEQSRKFITNFKVPEQTACSSQQDFQPANVQTDLLSKGELQLFDYPYFKRISAFDIRGFEQLSWTVDNYKPPSIRACDRPYFTETQRNHLWYFTDQGPQGIHFRVDPLYSKLTGQYLADIAEPVPIKQAGNSSSTLSVVIMVTPLISLIHPVLPPDYGFAVIDESGKVLFHSDAAKNSRENFLDETDQAEELRGAIIARKADLFDIHYSGSDYRAYFTPVATIQQSGWYLITFSNMASLESQRVERLLLFCTLVLIYLLVIIVPCSLLLALKRGPLLKRIWPSAEKRGTYYHLIITLMSVMLVFYLLIFRLRPLELLSMACLVPLFSVAGALFKLEGNERKLILMATIALFTTFVFFYWNISHYGIGWWDPFVPLLTMCGAFYFLASRQVTQSLGKLRLGTGFSLASFALLLLVAGFPCIALFKAAYDYEENVSTQREQLLTMEALERREARLVDDYFHTKISTEDAAFVDDLPKWLFIRRRLEAEKLDLYDTAFSDQQMGEIFVPGRELPPGADTGAAEKPIGGGPATLSWLATFLPHRVGSITHELGKPSTDLTKWIWNQEGSNRIIIQGPQSAQMKAWEGSPETMGIAKLASRDPVFLSHGLAYNLGLLEIRDFSVMAIFLAVFMLAMFYSVRSTLRRMFLMNIKIAERLPEITLDDALTKAGNFLLLSLPLTGKTKLLEQRNDIVLVDIATSVGKTLDLSSGDMPVVLDHFEFRMDSKEANRWKLELLEKLVVRQRRKVIIVTTIDPLFYFEAASGPSKTLLAEFRYERSLEQWQRVLVDFKLMRLQTSSPVISTAYYSSLWSSCTWNEQVALYDLAHDRWTNHKNVRAIEHLLQRGIVDWNPMFQFTEEQQGMAEFIRKYVGKEERKRWEGQDLAGLWDGLRIMLIILLVGTVATVLFFNQHEVLGYITTGISAILPFTKFLAEGRGNKALASALDEVSKES
jgi:hypothetical protein